MISALFQRFAGWIIGAFGLLMAIGGIYLKGRSAGKQLEQQKAMEEKAKTIEEVNSVQTNVARLPGNVIDERLRKWTRD